MGNDPVNLTDADGGWAEGPWIPPGAAIPLTNGGEFVASAIGGVAPVASGLSGTVLDAVSITRDVTAVRMPTRLPTILNSVAQVSLKGATVASSVHAQAPVNTSTADAVAAGLVIGWGGALTEPTPVGEVIMAAATAGAWIIWGDRIIDNYPTRLAIFKGGLKDRRDSNTP